MTCRYWVQLFGVREWKWELSVSTHEITKLNTRNSITRECVSIYDFELILKCYWLLFDIWYLIFVGRLMLFDSCMMLVVICELFFVGCLMFESLFSYLICFRILQMSKKSRKNIDIYVDECSTPEKENVSEEKVSSSTSDVSIIESPVAKPDQFVR